MKKLLLLLLLITLFTAALGYYGYDKLTSYRSPEEKTVVIDTGTSLKIISQKLEDEKVVSDALLFEWYVRLQKKASQIKAGTYAFTKGVSAKKVLSLLIQGFTIQKIMTIPEGYNKNDIGKLFIERNLIANKEEWEKLFYDKDFLTSLGIEADSFEGYLFPDTYYMDDRTTAKNLIEKMVSHFKKKITPEMTEMAKASGFTLHQWVTFASIIEKETGLGSERPLIASVFLNRMKKNMLLQTDPTVIYGIPNFNGNLTRKDLQTDTPYNTYTRPGLPPGPICSPGFKSLKAVIEPAQSDYLYFVGKGDGSHYFSKTLEEHNAAVRKYQLKK